MQAFFYFYQFKMKQTKEGLRTLLLLMGSVHAE